MKISHGCKNIFPLRRGRCQPQAKSASKIAARILVESQFKGPALRNYSAHSSAKTSIFRRGITLSIFHSMKQMFRSQGPATLEKTEWKFSFGQVLRSSF